MQNTLLAGRDLFRFLIDPHIANWIDETLFLLLKWAGSILPLFLKLPHLTKAGRSVYKVEFDSMTAFRATFMERFAV